MNRVRTHLELDEVARIAAEAGRIAAGRCGTDYATWEKVPGHPVCDVDLEVDAFLRERLGALDPEAGWLSEETLDLSDRIERRRLWVIDPIDGTRDYLRGRPGWCVSVALVEDRVPVLGVLSAPLRDELWTASRGQGSWRNGEKLRVSPRQTLAGARVPADQLPEADRDLVAVERPNSIALRIALVGSGEADLVATLRWGFEWDIAAAALIAEEAGATVTGVLGQPLAFNTASGEAFGVLASTPGIHQAAVERLRGRAMALV
ncbi:3'(2'),5'-bisphosphate nucleotidase CysQ [Sphingosinicella sp. CPCC 101087]|uniref:3'(2'),5'-bisphosphate nucleotidase CysQ n=1 Tax=Sphingosinicella sp. CPCC 101087 TaxID=2497754 RepID=UPI001FB05614|nr:3'(2'),5'-bisphosphate nucleotidase CysQ [Sphingosinicella sp. CPCC 101087]